MKTTKELCGFTIVLLCLGSCVNKKKVSSSNIECVYNCLGCNSYLVLNDTSYQYFENEGKMAVAVCFGVVEKTKKDEILVTRDPKSLHMTDTFRLNSNCCFVCDSLERVKIAGDTLMYKNRMYIKKAHI